MAATPPTIPPPDLAPDDPLAEMMKDHKVFRAVLAEAKVRLSREKDRLKEQLGRAAAEAVELNRYVDELRESLKRLEAAIVGLDTIAPPRIVEKQEPKR